MLVGSLSQWLGEDPASPVVQEKGKVDISFLDLTHIHLKGRTMTQLVVIPNPLLLF